MNLDALFSATQPIPTHALAAIAAIIIGGLQFALPKGTKLHRGLGYIWVLLMLAVSITSFFIHEIRLWGAFSPIHLLSIAMFGFLFFAVMHAKKGKIRDHQRAMTMTYVFALLVTGALTVLPERTMSVVLWG